MNDAAEPRPGWLLIGVSWLIILESAVWLASGLATVFVPAGTISPFAYLGAFIMMPIASAIMLTQHFAVFRRSKAFSQIAAVLLFATGGMWVFEVVSTIPECIRRGFELNSIWLLVPMAIHGGGVLYAGYITHSWFDQLRLLPPDVRRTIPIHSFSLRELLEAMAIVCVVTGLTVALVRSKLPQSAEHVSADRAPITLPPHSSDVTYWRGAYSRVSIEFIVDEEAFVHWLQEHRSGGKHGAKFEEIHPQGIPREFQREAVLTDLKSEPEIIIIRNGFRWGWASDLERGESAYYDRDAKRAYFSAWYN